MLVGVWEIENIITQHTSQFLALKWAVKETFHDYFYGTRFTVRTDNNPLTYVHQSTQLDTTGHRWLTSLSAYNFILQYRSGVTIIDADVLL